MTAGANGPMVAELLEYSQDSKKFGVESEVKDEESHRK